MFERPHHRQIAWILDALDADLLAAHSCWFGGGTALALEHGEYRESVDIDFLVSDRAGYRALREIVRTNGIAGLSIGELLLARPTTSDGYGIRTLVRVDAAVVKLEIVHEARIDLEPPAADRAICGVRALGAVDQVATKLLANDDRWADTSVFSRDLIDLAMMRPDRRTLEAGLVKAVGAYGPTVRQALDAAVAHFRERPQRLQACMDALSMTLPRAVVWQAIDHVASAVSAIVDH